MLRVAMVGFGAIASGVAEIIGGDAAISIECVILRQGSAAPPRLRPLLPHARIDSKVCHDAPGGASTDPESRMRGDPTAKPSQTFAPDLLVECAGHGAIEEHVLPALARGIACVVVSTGALSRDGLARRLEDAARTGRTRVHLVAGAIGAIDALAAAKIGGLTSVVYTGRKPPAAWSGTPAAGAFDLDRLRVAQCIFKGSARDAATLYPKNANVAATLALAGLGMDETQVVLMADPSVSDNVHEVRAHGTFGSFELTMRGKPLAANPKTSALTVYSVVRTLRNLAYPVTL